MTQLDQGTSRPNIPTQAPAPSAAPLENSNITAPQGEGLDALRRSIRDFKDERVNVAESMRRGAESNLRSTEKDIKESGVFSWVSGNTAALETQRAAEAAMVEQRAHVAATLASQLKQAEELAARYEAKLEVIRKAEAEQKLKQEQYEKEIAALKGNDRAIEAKTREFYQAEEKFHFEMQLIREDALAIEQAAHDCLSGETKVDTAAYQAALRGVNEKLEQGIKTLDNIETGLRVAHTTTVVVGAVAVTVATGGAGAGVAGAMIAGTVAGTTIGAVGNAVEAGGHVAYGNKTAGEAMSDAASQTVSDAKTAFTSSASAAVGGGIANGLSSTVTSSTGQAVVRHVVAPALVQMGNSTFATTEQVMAARSEYAKFIQSPEFQAAHGGTPEQLGPERMAEIREQFFQDRGLSWGNIAKNMAIDTTVAVAGSAIGAKVNPGGANQTLLKQGLGMAVEGTADVGLGVGAAYMRGEEINVKTVGQQVQNAVVGRVVSLSVGSVQRTGATKGDGTPGSEVKPENPGTYRAKVNELNEAFINATASRSKAAADSIGSTIKSVGQKVVGHAPESFQQRVSEFHDAAQKTIARVKGVTGAPKTEAAGTDAPQAAAAAATAQAKTQKGERVQLRTDGKPDYDAVRAKAVEHREAGKGPLRVVVSDVNDLAQLRELRRSLPPGSIKVEATKDVAAQVTSAQRMLDMGVETPYNKQLASWKVREPERINAGSPQEAGAALASARKSLEAGTTRVQLKIDDPETFRENQAELRKLATDPEFKGRLEIRASKEVVAAISRDIESGLWKAKAVEHESPTYKLRQEPDVRTQVASKPVESVPTSSTTLSTATGSSRIDPAQSVTTGPRVTTARTVATPGRKASVISNDSAAAGADQV